MTTLVVVGNGMVGFRFLRLFTERAPQDQYRIIVFGEEMVPAYDRVHLTDYFKAETPDELLLVGPDWYESNDIELYTGDPVVEIDRENHLVKSRSGRVEEFDYLVLATGSVAFVPPIEGIDTRGVFPYRTLDDVRNIKEWARGARSAAVIGGGLLGLEAAKALGDLGLEIAVIQNTSHLMQSQLDQETGSLLKSQVEELGIRVHVEHVTQSIAPAGDRLRMLFDDNDQLEVDLVVVAAGIRPRDELARQCGLKVDPRTGGIVVDDKLVTSDNEILAIGECACHRGVVYGLVGPGYEMAAVAVENLIGRERRQFESGNVSVRLKLDSIKVQVAGDVTDGVPIAWENDESRRTIRIEDGRITGAVSVGDWPEFTNIEAAVITGRRITQKNIEHFKKTGALWPEAVEPVTLWAKDRIVCSCERVSVEQITTLVKAGVRTVEALGERTGAGLVCGSCRPNIAQLCGDKAPDVPLVQQRTLLWLSATVTVTCLLFWLWPAPSLGASVHGRARALSVLWRDDGWQQVTGYVLLGVAAVALLLPLRKRIRRFRLAKVAWFRALHAVVGVMSVVMLSVHTGLRLGHNFNFSLMMIFVGLNLTGAAVGAGLFAQTKRLGLATTLAHRYRSVLGWTHWIFFWVFPVFVAFHILGVYYF